MIRQLRLALRSMLRERIYAFINIGGLTVGLCACLIVATVVIDDLSYDTGWKRADDIYRIVTVNDMGGDASERMTTSFGGLAPELIKLYPEVESFSRLAPGTFHLKIRPEDAEGMKVKSLNTDSAVWEVLDFKIIAGDPVKFKPGITNLVISESFRKQHFTNKDPIGTIVYDVPAYGDKPKEFMITGVISDIPGNTHLRAEVIAIERRRKEELSPKQWGSFTPNYLVLKPGTDAHAFTRKMNAWYKSFVTVEKPYQFELQPIRSVYLDSTFAKYQPVKGSRQNIYIFSGVAILLLIIACVNFVNLSTARSITRIKETGVRKVLGASRTMVVMQFLREALVIFFVSAVLAIAIYNLSIQYIEIYLEHELVQTIVSKVTLFATAVAMILVVGVLTGLYPAWLISGLDTANSLKGNFFKGKISAQQWSRRFLVVFQFSISIVVLVGMFIVQRQLRFMETTDPGFDKENLMAIDYVSWDDKGTSFRNEVAALPGVRHASISSWIPSNGAGYMSREIDDPNNPGRKIIVWYISGDVHLASTLGLRLKSGRLLSNEYATDAMNEDSLQQHDRKTFNALSEVRPALITETTAATLHVTSLDSNLRDVKTVPVGIVKDFHNQSFHNRLGPTIIIAATNPQYGGMLVKVDPGTEQQAAAAIKNLWRKFYPNKLLELNNVDNLLAAQYEPERKLKQLFTFFSILSMVLASLGIFGLVVHSAQQRVKEIGVRKVLGASVASIVRLLSSEFVRLIMIAVLVATPIAWYLMSQWLDNFSYRIDIQLWMFLVAGAVTCVTALATISFQAIRAALANPVKNLRDE